MKRYPLVLSSVETASEFTIDATPWAAEEGLCTLHRVDELRDDGEFERQLCREAQLGDRQALGKLLRKHGPRLYRTVLLPRLGSRAAAEDALSITYTKVVENLQQFEWQNVGFYPWLRMIGFRVALDQIKKSRRERLFEPQDIERELDRGPASSQETDALERYDLASARLKVDEVLSRLNPRYALAIRRRVLEAQPREDFAAELGVSVPTADVVLHRAMTALRKALNIDGGS